MSKFIIYWKKYYSNAGLVAENSSFGNSILPKLTSNALELTRTPRVTSKPFQQVQIIYMNLIKVLKYKLEW